jgi:hypothetical protein
MTTYNNTITNTISTLSILSNTQYLKDTISNIITINSTLPLVSPVITLNETITLSQSISLNQIAELISELLVNNSITDNSINKESLSVLLDIVNSTYVTLQGSVSDSVAFTSTFSYLVKQIELISNVIVFAESYSDKAIFLSIILNTLNLADSASKSLSASISETLIIQQTLLEIHKMVLVLLESITTSEVYKDSYVHILNLTESLSTSNTLSSLLLGKSGIEDTFIISIPTASGQDVYLGYVYGPEGKSITTYTNYPFDGSAVFNGKYLFFNKSGLYEYGSSTDDGSIIKSYIKTAGLKFGTSNLKMVPKVYIGYTTDNVCYLKVSVDGKGEVTYKLNKKTDNLSTKMIEIGKGLVGTYFQFELITEAETFDMETIEFMPIKLSRKL